MKQSNISVGGIAYKNKGLRGSTGDNLALLLDVIAKFNRLSDVDQIMEEIGHATQSLMKTQVATLLLVDKRKQQLYVRYSTGPLENEILNKCIPAGQGFSGWVAEHKLPLMANDLTDEEGKNTVLGGEMGDTFTVKNMICIPLLDKDNNLLGVLEAVNRYDPPRMSEDDIPLFQVLANHAAATIERVQAEQEQVDQLKEQDMYLTEIHHRVKNDLALISGIVELESLDLKDKNAQGVLKNIQTRIKSMAVVYELLSGEGSHTRAEVGTYFKKLIDGISNSLWERNKKIDIKIHTDQVIIDPYKALSCGLILNELVLNSYKYAFKDRTEGSIDIVLKKNKNDITIDYKDDGPGLPDDFKIEEQESTGFTMIRALVDQLDGTLDLQEGQGAHYVIHFRACENGDRKILKRVAS